MSTKGSDDSPQFTEPHYCDEHDVFECPDCNPPEKEERR